MIYNIYTNNPTCPYCIKAKQLLGSKNIEYNYNVLSTQDLKAKFPSATTVPQILKGSDEYVGGFDELHQSLVSKKKRTMFNAENTGHITGDYPLFFGEDLGFADSINTPYPILDEMFQTQMSQIWNEFEIDLGQDRQDMLSVSRSKVDLVVINLLWQTLVDSMASRAITGLLMEHVSNSDLENWYNAVALFESIHARTYLHIIKQTFTDPNQALLDGYANKNIIKRARRITEAFDNVANLPHDAPPEEIEKKVYLAIFALYMLESVNFMNSFSVTFGVAETGVFQGIAQDVKLICRDELLHAKGGREIIKIDKSKILKYKKDIQDLYNGILADEKEWNTYLFSEGRQCIGLSVGIQNEYVDYLAAPVAKLLELEHAEPPKTTPVPFMVHYTDSSKIQVAAQELQLTSYLVNAVQAPVDMEGTLVNLRKEFSYY